MPKYKTSTGTVTVDNWGYQLQGLNGNPLNTASLASATHDLLVIDSSDDGTNANRFTEGEITRMKDGMGGLSVVASYVSIGEANDFRDYWDKDWTTTGKASGKLTAEAPGWLGPINPDWPEGRKVRYWDEGWQDIIFNDAGTGEIDNIVKAGSDAAYLDIVDGYYFWGAEVKPGQWQKGDPKNEKQAAQRMVDFIVDMTEHSRETNPDFFVIPQNGGWILDALRAGTPDNARIQAYREVIGGIAIEDLYFHGGKEENNALRPDEDLIAVLKRDFLSKGVPVYVVDYINDKAKVEKFYELALEDGFIPYAAPDRDLDRLVGTHDGDPAYIRPTAGADALRGSMLSDRIDGLSGNDRINGRGGNDKLEGGPGKDQLTGGAGKDQFIFATKPGIADADTIRDFDVGSDLIVLDRGVFTGLAKGGLPASAFAIGSEAADRSDRVIYDRATGELYYDADGSGRGKGALIAELAAGLSLTAGDFLVV